jgi:hypothetical protein
MEVVILVAIAYMFNAMMDISSIDGYSNDFWNKSKTWKYKYKKGLPIYQKKWYYFGIITPKYEEKFPFSSTYFVFLTDGWHFLKFLFINTNLLIIACLSDWYIPLIIGCKLAQWIGFTLMYEIKDYRLKATIFIITLFVLIYFARL